MENHFNSLHEVFLNLYHADDFGDSTFERTEAEFESHHWHQDTPFVMLTHFGSGEDRPIKHRIERMGHGQVPYTFTDDSFCFSVTDALRIRVQFAAKLEAFYAAFPNLKR